MSSLRALWVGWLLTIAAFLVNTACAQQPSRGAVDRREPSVKSLRLYVFDCGAIKNVDPQAFGLKREHLPHLDVAVPCHLIVHPRGTLIWDTGVVPDGEIGTGLSAGTPLRQQLAAIGYRPEDITYLALSHHHFDHTANANMFSSSTWLVRQVERDLMFGANPPPSSKPSQYAELKNSKTIIVDRDEYDVFGDGTVISKAAPGHTPGHQVLILKLAKTGAVMLGGDLYHFSEQRHTDIVPTIEFNKEQTLKSRAVIEAYLTRTGTALWIGHDYAANSKLKKSPDFYE
jgi:glyoxylase-like metal-dependent hydrolase (beta-lactamase superfamily II)